MGFVEAFEDVGLADRCALDVFVARLNAVSDEDFCRLVIVIGTGGTISMKEVDGVRVPDMDCREIMQLGGARLVERFMLESFDLFHVDSSQLDYSHVGTMALVIAYVSTRLRRDDFVGFLVLHGTDTMSYSAAAVSLMMGAGLPFSIVFTGAQKPIQDPMSDAVNNLRNSLYTLEALRARDMAEVLVVMGRVAVLGTSSEKVDDERIEAFDAPLHQFVTRFDRLRYPVELASWLRPRRDFPFEPRVWLEPYGKSLVVRSYTGLDPELVAQRLDGEQTRCVFLYSYGAGTVHKGVLEAIVKRAEQLGLPVFSINPTFTEAKQTYQSGQEMLVAGVAPLLMTLPTALAKAEIAWRAHGADVEAFKAFMVANYVGEVPHEDVRYIESR